MIRQCVLHIKPFFLPRTGQTNGNSNYQVRTARTQIRTHRILKMKQETLTQEDQTRLQKEHVCTTLNALKKNNCLHGRMGKMGFNLQDICQPECTCEASEKAIPQSHPFCVIPQFFILDPTAAPPPALYDTAVAWLVSLPPIWQEVTPPLCCYITLCPKI